jgi:hypothetical protein
VRYICADELLRSFESFSDQRVGTKSIEANTKTLTAGLPDFSWHNIPARGKIYQINKKYTKWALNISNGFKIYIPNDHKIHQHLPLQDPPKCTRITIFGQKINHLATPVDGRRRDIEWSMSDVDALKLSGNFLEIRHTDVAF